MRLLVATLFSVLLYSPNALASELTLSWQAPLGCPSLADVRAGLETRLQRPVRLGPDAGIGVEAAVTLEREGFRLELITHTETGTSRRELYTPSCNELARATVLLASLLLSTQAAAARPAVLPPTASGDSSIQLHAALSAVLDAGRLPHFGAGVAALLGLELGALRLEAGALFLPARSSAIEQLPEAQVSLQLLAADTSLCYALTRAPRVAPCVFLELGSLMAKGQRLAQNERGSSLWLSAGPGAQLGVPLTSWLDLQLELRLGIPFRRAQIATRDLGLVYRTPAWNGQLRAGLATYFR